MLAPATLAALPSTRAMPDRDVFYVADPISSIRVLVFQFPSYVLSIMYRKRVMMEENLSPFRLAAETDRLAACAPQIPPSPHRDS